MGVLVSEAGSALGPAGRVFTGRDPLSPFLGGVWAEAAWRKGSCRENDFATGILEKQRLSF